MLKLVLILSIFLSAALADDPHPCDETDNEFAINPRGCRWFFGCTQNPPSEGRCESPFHFDYGLQACNWPDLVNCAFDDEWKNMTCPDIGVSIIPHPYACSKYTICFNGMEQDRECPRGLHYSPFEQNCVEPFYADCEIDLNTCLGADYDTPTFKMGSRDCSVYYLCFRNQLLAFRCGPGQHFDLVNNWCTTPQDANCQLENPLPPIPNLPNTLEYDCTGYPQAARVPHPESCYFWFACVNEESHIFWCAPGMIFDIVTQVCTLPQDGTCVLDGRVEGNRERIASRRDQRLFRGL